MDLLSFELEVRATQFGALRFRYVGGLRLSAQRKPGKVSLDRHKYEANTFDSKEK